MVGNSVENLAFRPLREWLAPCSPKLKTDPPFLQTLNGLCTGGGASSDSSTRPLLLINPITIPLASPNVEANADFECWPNLAILPPPYCSHVYSSWGVMGGEGQNVRGGCKSVATNHGERVTGLTTIFWYVTVGCLLCHEKVWGDHDGKMLLDYYKSGNSWRKNC